MNLEDWLADRAAERERAGLTRTLRPRPARSSVLDLAGNDYLGLATDPRVCAAAADAAREWGAGSGASRLVTGSLDLHAELESQLAAFCGLDVTRARCEQIAGAVRSDRAYAYRAKPELVALAESHKEALGAFGY